jgi:hypothetical protein
MVLGMGPPRGFGPVICTLARAMVTWAGVESREQRLRSAAFPSDTHHST